MSENTDNKFSHIKIKPAEYDVVIHAGIRHFEEEASKEEVFKEEVSKKEDACIEPEAVPMSSSEPNKNGYHPTTLDDIHESKMPKMQIVVVSLAVAAILAFAIWYIFFA